MNLSSLNHSLEENARAPNGALLVKCASNCLMICEAIRQFSQKIGGGVATL